MKKHILLALALSGLAGAAYAAADTYTIDPAYSPAHFDIDRVGFSSQRGSFNKTSGQITLDLVAKKGSVEFTISTPNRLFTSYEQGKPLTAVMAMQPAGLSPKLTVVVR